MFNLSGSEIVVILLLALVVLGPEKLPEALRRAGRTYAELKKLSSGFQSEMRGAFEEPVKEMRETADLLRKAATFDAPTDTKPTKLLSEADARQPPDDDLDDGLDDDGPDDVDGLDDDDDELDDGLDDDLDDGLDVDGPDDVDGLDDDDEEPIEDDELLDAAPADRPRDETPQA